jgi:hypothetical protein
MAYPSDDDAVNMYEKSGSTKLHGTMSQKATIFRKYFLPSLVGQNWSYANQNLPRCREHEDGLKSND